MTRGGMCDPLDRPAQWHGCRRCWAWWGCGVSVSRCLGPAVRALMQVPRAQWREYIEQLPERCPHGDCTAQLGCRDYVAGYFRIQWRMAVKREQLDGER